VNLTPETRVVATGGKTYICGIIFCPGGGPVYSLGISNTFLTEY